MQLLGVPEQLHRVLAVFPFPFQIPLVQLLGKELLGLRVCQGLDFFKLRDCHKDSVSLDCLPSVAEQFVIVNYFW